MLKHVYDRYGYGLTTYSVSYYMIVTMPAPKASRFQPLDGGFLTGKYNSGEIPQDSRYATSQNDPWIAHLRKLLASDEGKERIAKVKRLEIIAKEMQTDLPTLSLAWVMKNPRVSGFLRLIQLIFELTITALTRRCRPLFWEPHEYPR